MLNVLSDFKAAQRLQVITHGDTLTKLAETGIVQPIAQFRLAHEHDLKELAIVGLKVREQTALFE